MDIVYNVYYATTINGPWTLANPTPIDHDQLGNEFTITGLTRGTLYYIQVVGGYMDGDEFIPLISQPIGPTPTGAKGIGAAPPLPIATREYVVRRVSEGALGGQFEVSIVV